MSEQEIHTAIQLFQNGNINQSRKILDKYIVTQPNDVNANLLSAAISATESDFLAVVIKCRKVLSIEPENTLAIYNAAVASDKLNNHQDTLAFASQILKIDPANIHARIFQAKALYNLGKINECIQFLEVAPQEYLMNSPALSIKLAECYMSVSENEKAILIFKNNIAANINPALCFHNIGIIEDRRGNIDEAIRAYQSTISIKPASLNSNYNLAFLLNKKGDKPQALKIINRCFEIQDSPKVRQAYVVLLSTASISHIGQAEANFIVDVIGDDVTNAQALSSLVMALLIHQYPVINSLHSRANKQDYNGFAEIFKKDVNEISKNKLLQLFYLNLPITNYAFERFSKMLRRALLLECYEDTGTGNDVSNLCSSIAIRCYIDGYVFTTDKDELKAVDELINNMLMNKGLADKQSLSVLTMYISLYELSKKHDVSTEISGDGDVFNKLVKLQLDDNLVEEEIRKTIESPAEIIDETSLTVQSQYECNPYPVWQILNLRQPEPINEIIHKITSFTKNVNPVVNYPDILIAGCGTGSHALQTAMRIEHKSMTALDLSKKSLAFAKRKANEFGFDKINFKQLDILQVSCLERKFDLIESVGVLHHMQDPLTGFKCLLDTLKPGGLMNIGLYSKLGRRYIIKAKSIYDDPNRYISDDEIRQLRVDIMESDNDELINNISGYKDFYSLHDCRDMIFHENENNYNISELSKLINDAGLEFIGFDLHDSPVLSSFHNMFPGSDTQSDLKNWEKFEEKYPDTFASMYVFWCRKKS